jgi:hypothetical protein
MRARTLVRKMVEEEEETKVNIKKERGEPVGLL